MKRGIAVAGVLLTDKIKYIRSLPGRGELTAISSIEDSLGGAVANAGMSLAALDPDLPVRLVALVGDDADGRWLISRLSEHKNIDVSRIVRQGNTAFTDVYTLEDTRERTFFVYNESNDCFSEEHVDIGGLDADLFHIGYALLLKKMDEPDAEYGTRMARLLRNVQAAGIQTSLDVVSEASGRHAKIVPPSLRYCDYFIVNEIEAGNTAGIPLRDEKGGLILEKIPEALRALLDMGVRKWVVIHAPEGGFGIDKSGTIARQMSYRLPDGYIKGTVGAGDAFCAGVLLAAHREKTLEDALLWGNASAACSLSTTGATEGMRRMEDIFSFLEECGAKVRV